MSTIARNDLKGYFSEVCNYSKLTPEEEKGLSQMAKRGVEKARNKLITSHLRMVIPIAKKYLKNNVDMDELIQEGNIALINAVDNFDSSFNVRLSIYAKQWITEFIKRKVNRERKRDYSVESDLQYNNYMNENELGFTMEKNIQDDRMDHEMDFDQKDYMRHVKYSIKDILDKEERIVIFGRYFCSKKKKTLKDIAKVMNVSLETVRNIEKRALIKIRRKLKKQAV